MPAVVHGAEVPYLTRMMLTVRDADEAMVAAAVGVDDVEWMPPPEAEADPALARAIRVAFPGRFRIRLRDARATRDLSATCADEVVVHLEALSSKLRGDARADGDGPVLIGMVAATGGEVEAVGSLRGRVDGGMLDTRPRRLIEDGGVARLDAFADACRRAGLPFGFAGGLEAPDIARLLLLEPDVLGFDTGARTREDPEGRLDVRALEAIRALIPRAAVIAGSTGDAVVPSSAVVAQTTEGFARDLLFVRDFVTTMSIGAYRQEHGRRQRVRFSVEAAVVRAPVPPRDMRDVFSYDVIIETIRVLAERGHATFVETLAEEIAVALLSHAALTSVTVRVEKLDVVDGAVGIEIRRCRRGER